MSKTSKQQEHPIGGFDETYLDDLPDIDDPNFAEKFVEAVNKPIGSKIKENKE